MCRKLCFIHVLIYATELADTAIITFRSIIDFIHPHVIWLTDPKLWRVWTTITWFACQQLDITQQLANIVYVSKSRTPTEKHVKTMNYRSRQNTNCSACKHAWCNKTSEQKTVKLKYLCKYENIFFNQILYMSIKCILCFLANANGVNLTLTSYYFCFMCLLCQMQWTEVLTSHIANR